jgi:transposase
VSSKTGESTHSPDDTFLRARSGGDGVGVTRVGKGCCLQVLCDLDSLPASAHVYAAGPAEARGLERLLTPARTPKLLIGDAAYDTNRLRALVDESDCVLITSRDYGRRLRSRDGALARELARHWRWRVERLFAWLGAYRRVLTRWEKSLHNFTEIVYLALADIIVKHRRKDF